MNWYYAVSGEQKGPVPEEAFQELVAQGAIRDETLVWHEGMPEWSPWAEVRPAPPQGTFVDEAIVAPTPPDSIHGALTTGTDERVLCAECGLRFPMEETLEFGTQRVCGPCKPKFIQRLREGALHSLPFAGGEGFISAEELVQRDYNINAGECISEAWRLLFRNPSLHLMGGVLAFFVYMGVNVASAILNLIPFVGGPVSQFLSQATEYILIAGLFTFYAEIIRGQPVSVGRALSGFGPRLVQLFIAAIPLALIITIAYLPFFVMGASSTIFNPQPGGAPTFNTNLDLGMVALGGLFSFFGFIIYMYFRVHWMYVPALVLDKNIEWRDALRLSHRVVRKHPWQNFWLMILAGIVAMVGMFACGIGILVSFPLAMAAIAIQYNRLFASLQPGVATTTSTSTPTSTPTPTP